MIVGSLLLILVAVALLVLGLANGSSALLVGSIAASLLAAIALVIGARQAAAARAGHGPLDAGPDEPRDVDEVEEAAARGHARSAEWLADERSAPDLDEPAGRAGGQGVGLDEPLGAGIPTQTNGASAYRETETREIDFGATAPRQADPFDDDPVGDAPFDDDEDPPDEPAPQLVPAADAARVARMAVDVLVIDGRPRYHLAGCVHLLGRESEPLPVGEAVELGFTPCSLCEPDSALLADARRV